MPRLDHLLARNLGCSRAEARRLLSSGAIEASSGEPLSDPRREIPAASLPSTVLLDGNPRLLHDAYHLMLNKPDGTVTALVDPRHAVAYDLVRDAPLFAELRPVGRLDRDTTGLLLFTTDGQWLHRLTHPRHAVPRRYQAALARQYQTPPPDFALADGHRPTIAELRALPRQEIHPALERPSEATHYASLTIVGGAYHEVRRIFAALGSHVLALCRVGFGRLTLPPDLGPGRYRPISPDEV